ncbi:hypothetical protein [Flavivirga rizhaonensis]|uniref:hypothetical protein n=1 Tax=Flavivirga rizhaonensis TaxID=2559571 RepID=UPI0011AE3045|nr:hypothetical protein [Flavivirga rizhaonensis]
MYSKSNSGIPEPFNVHQLFRYSGSVTALKTAFGEAFIRILWKHSSQFLNLMFYTYNYYTLVIT